MITARTLSRDEIKDIWSIDRSETIDGIYYLENGALVLKQEHYDMHGWPPGEAEKYTPVLEACFDRGGWFYGLFDNRQLVGAAVLEGCFIGRNKDQLQLKFLHISSDYRRKGLGRWLFDQARVQARKRGAKRMYVSATPSEHTISFYLHSGCRVTQEPDPELFALEPEDIHLECDLQWSPWENQAPPSQGVGTLSTPL
jgi:predicted N-acetyltransferase YhbS